MCFHKNNCPKLVLFYLQPLEIVDQDREPSEKLGPQIQEQVTSIKYKVERDKRYLPYIELGRWLCSHFQLETPLNFHKPITQKLYNLEK